MVFSKSPRSLGMCCQEAFLNLSSLSFFEDSLQTFFPELPTHNILIAQMYCFSVYVLWPFRGPHPILISEIVSIPWKPMFAPLEVILFLLRMHGLESKLPHSVMGISLALTHCSWTENVTVQKFHFFNLNFLIQTSLVQPRSTLTHSSPSPLHVHSFNH